MLKKKSTVNKPFLSRLVLTKKSEKYVIYQSWKIINSFLSFASCFTYAYMGAFLDVMSPESRQTCFVIDLVYTLTFVLDIIIHFFVAYEDPALSEPVKCLRLIAMNYLKGMFCIDFISSVPLYWFVNSFLETKNAKLLFLLKIVRLYKGFKILNHQQLMKEVKQYYNKKLLNLIKKNKDLANNQFEDNTFFTRTVHISYALRGFRMVIIWLCLSFLCGMLWYIFCDVLLPSDDELYGNLDRE